MLIMICRAGLKDNKIAVVCSARSTGKKVEGTTSRSVVFTPPCARLTGDADY